MLVAWHTSRDDGFILTLAVNSSIGLSLQHYLAMETIVLQVRNLFVYFYSSVCIFINAENYSLCVVAGNEVKLFMCCVVIDSKEPSCHSGEGGLPLELTPLQTITAALSLTAQLVSVLACYLDVILPQRLDYRYYHCHFRFLFNKPVVQVLLHVRQGSPNDLRKRHLLRLL